jgi:uncharacterized membrane protein
MATTTAERFRENAAGIASVVVTGVWMAALFTGQDWWLAALLFGYIVVVPVVAMLFDEDEEDDASADGRRDGATRSEASTGDRDRADATDTERRDALETLRDRYARGELTDEQFERKVERLLETESLEDLEDRTRERERSE